MKRFNNTFITIFVILWLFIFHYESIRHFYLEPLLGKSLPYVKFLFPPAGWIMFYNVGDGFGTVEVYGVDGDNLVLIDPHDIIRTRTIGFDNIHRGILGVAADKSTGPQFCRHLFRLFPNFDKFVVTVAYYPEMAAKPYKRIQQVEYQCAE